MVPKTVYCYMALLVSGFACCHGKISIDTLNGTGVSEYVHEVINKDGSQEWMREIVVHLLGIAEEMSSKLEKLGSKVDCLDKDMREEIKEVKDHVTTSQDDVRAVEQRLTSKFTSDMSRMVDKVMIELLQHGERAGTGIQKDCGRNDNLYHMRKELAKISHFIVDNFPHIIERLRQGAASKVPGVSAHSDKSNSSMDSSRLILEKIDRQISNISAVVEKLNTPNSDLNRNRLMLEKLDRQISNMPVSSLNKNTLILENIDRQIGNISAEMECLKTLKDVRQIEQDNLTADPTQTEQVDSLPTQTASSTASNVKTKCEKAPSYSVIYPSNEDLITVPHLCETHTLGGGWIVFQRRSVEKYSFHRNWDDYKNGFELTSDDFWLGLEAVHNLTRSATHKLRVHLTTDEQAYYAEYSNFSVGSEAENYTLQIGNHSGTAPDGLNYHRGMPFSTYDRDNDKLPRTNCAADRKSGWWHRGCDNANLNRFISGGIWWAGLSGVIHSEMMMRRADGED